MAAKPLHPSIASLPGEARHVVTDLKHTFRYKSVGLAAAGIGVVGVVGMRRHRQHQVGSSSGGPAGVTTRTSSGRGGIAYL